MNRAQGVIQSFQKAVLGNYTRAPLVMVRGKGSWLWDAAGRKYLDFFPGFGVGALGHCHPVVVAAIRRQARRLIHVPNTVMHPGQGELAERLLALAGFRGKAFFCNSGAEANEAAIKLARRWHQVVLGRPRSVIVSVRDSFHGRTLGALAATGNVAYHRGFAPLPKGFVHVPLNDITAAAAAIRRRPAAFLIEPVLGEGGIQLPTTTYLRALRHLTARAGTLLIFDEVQCGCGRTGTYFAAEQAGVTPDAYTLAKPLAGGLPMGALLVREKFAVALGPGSHATTFGGSPLVCAAALAAVKVASAPATLRHVRRMGGLLRAGLEGLHARYPGLVGAVRGRGVMLGVHLTRPGAGFVARCRALGLLLNCTHGTVIRVMPAMTVSRREIALALALFERALVEEADQPAGGS